MNGKKYLLLAIATINIQIAVAQTTRSIRLMTTDNTPFLGMYGAGGAYKGFLWNRGADDIELGTVGAAGNLLFSVNGNQKLSVFNNGQVAINGGPYSILNSSIVVNGILTVRDIQYGNEAWSFQTFTPTHTFTIVQNSVLRTYLNADGDWIVPSDLRLKQNISAYKTVIEGVKKLNISTYAYKSNPGSQRSFGLIAQNVLENFPEIVSETADKDGKKLLGIAYGKTGVLALKAVQEQQQILESLQREIEQLKKLVSELATKR
ncbi:MAG: tail fiber domain-containing protein [Bacteroidota bacterium]